MANTDIAAPAVSGGFSLGSLSGLLKRSDLGLAIGIMAILIVLILPLPTWLLDVSQAF
jgi:flagellar biosynthesis protein FlhA